MPIILSNVTPDPIDSRDYIFEWNKNAVLPVEIDLRPEEPPVEDQLNIGSCTANAVVGAGESFLLAGNKFVDLSRLFNYYTSRELLGQYYLTVDSGSTLRMALRAASKVGIATEATWQYSSSNVATKPSDAAYNEASNFKLGSYFRIPNFSADVTTVDVQHSIQYALGKGYPVVISMYVGSKLLTIKPGEVYTQINNVDNSLIGGHAMLIVGCTEVMGTPVCIVRNSWGTAWGDRGYFYMSFSAINCNVIDMWVPKDFAGVSTIGPDLIEPALPTSDSTIKDVVTYVFFKNFGRLPKQAGLDFWSKAVLDYIEPHIIAGASPADKAYMDANIPAAGFLQKVVNEIKGIF